MRPPDYPRRFSWYAAGCMLGLVSSACTNDRSGAATNSELATVGDGLVDIEFRGRPMLAMRRGGQLFIEGDIRVSPSDLGPAAAEPPPEANLGQVTQACRAANAGIDNKWLDGVVPYEFNTGDFTDAQKSVVQAVMAKLSRVAPGLTFRPAQSTDASAIRYYRTGCDSGVGRWPGQRMPVNIGCSAFTSEDDGAITHELMHALGLFHEQTRKDRDTYVSIAWHNLNGCPSTATGPADCGWVKCSTNPSDCGCTGPSDCVGFAQYVNDSARVDLGPYDYLSVLHYFWGSCWKRDGLVVMTALQPGGELMGTGEVVSPTDGENLRTLYPSPRTKSLVFLTNSGSYDLCALDGREGDLSTAWTGSSVPALAALSTGRTVPASQLALRDYTVTCNARSLFWASTYDYPNSTVFPNYSAAPPSSIENFSATGTLRVLSAGLIPVLLGIS